MGTYRGTPFVLFSLHYLQWAQNTLQLGGIRDGIVLSLGIVSVISWSVAEVPQIVTNYKQKSTEGLSVAFLLTWLIGDLFNFVGCLLEPATLPTQLYTALLYTITTLILTAQTVYYGRIYPSLKGRKVKEQKYGLDEKLYGEGRLSSIPSDKEAKPREDWENGSSSASKPIPVAAPTLRRYGSSDKCMYYMSARSLSKSPVPTMGSWLARSYQNSAPNYEQHSTEEPLLENLVPASAQPVNTRRMLCVLSSVMLFVGTLNLHLSMNTALNEPPPGTVILVGRKLLQGNAVDSSSMLHDGGSRWIGTFLGWTMTVIYLGGRLPQICLNIKRGNVEGLNPLMFLFALVGNSTYVGSILVNSLKWSDIQPNLPWLVDAGGCVILDSFILLQVAYFQRRNSEDSERRQRGDDSAAQKYHPEA